RFIWESYRREEELNGAFEEVKRLQRIISEKETARETANASLAKTEKDKNRYQQELHRIHTEKTKHETERETLLAQLQYVRPGDYEQTDPLTIENEKIRLLEETAELEKVFTENSEQLTARTQKQSVLNGSLEARRKEQAQEAIEWDREKKKLSGKIPEWSFRTQEEIEDILKEPVDTVAERALQAQYQEALFGSRQQVEQLTKELGTREYNPEAHRILQTKIRDLGELVAQKNREIGTVQKNLDELVQKLKDLDNFEKERERLGLRAENIKTLKSLFKASGFVNYISTVYLQNLCRAANERFSRLTRQKLRLELTAGNNFEVRDYMNGGKTRSVKTLSGGQTFQAALSLALALADNIQQITASNQNFFFLDEGFGSLDKESLAVVFDTLKSLRRETRMVGIISHVEEMQQEIEVHLRIEHHEERGSVIRASWTT
ncbi:MAG: SbcC/MukB-like Walker B domain-containing protein, partial [Bacteroidales bacterium]